MQEKKCIIDSIEQVTLKENGKIGLKKICKGHYSYGEVYSDWYDEWVEKCDPFEEERVLIPCMFDKIVSVDEHYFLVSENGKWGLYSEKAKLLKPLYDTIKVIRTTKDAIRIVNADGKLGLCSLSAMLLKPVYNDIKLINTINYFLNIIKVDGKLGLCSEERLLLEPVYNNLELSILSNNDGNIYKSTIGLVKADGKYGVCKHKLMQDLMVLDPAYLEIQLASKKWDILTVRTMEGKAGLFGVDPDGWIIEPRYHTIEVLAAIDNKGYETGYSAIIADGLYGLLSVKALQINPEYSWGKVARAARIHFNEKLKKPRKP